MPRTGFGFAKHVDFLIFVLIICRIHAWTAKLYGLRALLYAENSLKCYYIEENGTIPSFHTFFAIFTSYMGIWLYPSLTNRHPPTPHSLPPPHLATCRQLHVELLHRLGGNCCHLPHRVWASATKQHLIWVRKMRKV